MAATAETHRGYSFQKINGGIAVYLGVVTNVAHAACIMATEAEARAWVDARPC